MATNIRIIHAHEFVKATPEGQLDFEKSKKLMMEIASASAPLDDFEIILDLRKVHTEMSVADVWNLAAELCNFRKTFSRKTAILCAPERVDYGKLLALGAQNRGLPVRAFTSFEDAIEWLVANGI